MCSKNKIVICFFGVCSRSIKYTHHNHIKNIIDTIKQDYDYDIYVLNNNVGDTLIDNTKQFNDDHKIIESNIFEEMNQVDIDEKINEKISKDNIIAKMRNDYCINTIRNAMRQMFLEEQVGLFLEKNIKNYKSAIVCNSDIYFLNKINLGTIRDSMILQNSVFTSSLNDAEGYTNGFYIGSLEPLIKILKRFSILEKLLPTNHDYEYLLKQCFDMQNVTRIITEIDFVKIRSNKKIARQGKMSDIKYNSIINNIQQDINSIT
jgi:hypothetical protein